MIIKFVIRYGLFAQCNVMFWAKVLKIIQKNIIMIYLLNIGAWSFLLKRLNFKYKLFLHICLFLVINQMLRLGAMLQVDHIQWMDHLLALFAHQLLMASLVLWVLHVSLVHQVFTTTFIQSKSTTRFQIVAFIEPLKKKKNEYDIHKMFKDMWATD